MNWKRLYPWTMPLTGLGVVLMDSGLPQEGFEKRAIGALALMVAIGLLYVRIRSLDSSTDRK